MSLTYDRNLGLQIIGEIWIHNINRRLERYDRQRTLVQVC